MNNSQSSAKYDPCLHVVLYQPEIPPNTGNIGRTCVGIGAKLWLVKPLGFRLDEKELRRAGLDYWPHLDWEVVENWGELSAKLLTPLLPRLPWLFTKKGSVPYTNCSYNYGDVLIFGCETRGLPEEILAEYSSQRIRIPTRPQIRSLNLSAAAAVACFEAVRQLGLSFEAPSE